MFQFPLQGWTITGESNWHGLVVWSDLGQMAVSKKINNGIVDRAL